MYTVVKLKNELSIKTMLILMLLSISFSFVFIIFKKSVEAPTSFKVDIIDEDKTELSKRAVKNIAGLDGVTVSEREPDIKYIIKKGFEKHFSEGEFTGLIEVKKNNFKPGASLLNDRVATGLVSDYIYQNLYDRIKAEEEISFDEYEKNLSGTELENEILLISVNDRKIEENQTSDINFSDYMVLFFLLLIGLNIGANQITGLKRRRNNGIADRLKLSGVKETTLILDEMIVSNLKYIWAVLLVSLILKAGLRIYLVAVALFYINLLADCVLEKISKSEEAYIFASRSAMILFLIIGMAVNFYF